MEIIISNSSDKPIYEQICMQVKSFIMDGTLSAGEALPSMRALAKDLHISVITVQRAYEDLTRDGFIETVSGKGSFVASQNREFIQEEQLRIAEELFCPGADDTFRQPFPCSGSCPAAGTDTGGNLFVLLPALDAERNRRTKRLDTQHNRTAYPACLEAAERGNGGAAP